MSTALRRVRAFAEIRVWSRTPAHAARFAEEVGASVMAAEDAVRGADVIVTATAAKAPILEGAWLKPGAHVNAIGWGGYTSRELDDAAMANVVVVESREAALDQCGDVILSGAEIYAELGEILAGAKAGAGRTDHGVRFGRHRGRGPRGRPAGLRGRRGRQGMIDPYGRTRELGEPALTAMIARLEQRGGHPSFAAMLHAYLDRLPLAAARSVLDLGCGTGVAARAVASRPEFAGRIVGIDLSPHMVAAARRRAARAGAGRAGHLSDRRLSGAGGGRRRLRHRDRPHPDEPRARTRRRARRGGAGGAPRRHRRDLRHRSRLAHLRHRRSGVRRAHGGGDQRRAARQSAADAHDAAAAAPGRPASWSIRSPG